MTDLALTQVQGAVADTYSSFLGSRILGGIGMAPYEVLVQATISDLYFVHEASLQICIITLMLQLTLASAELDSLSGIYFCSAALLERASSPAISSKIWAISGPSASARFSLASLESASSFLYLRQRISGTLEPLRP